MKYALSFILPEKLSVFSLCFATFPVPLVAPAGITGHNTSSTSIRVAWQPVSSDDVNIRGIHRGYRVYYKPIKTSRPSVLMNVTVDVYTTHLQLTNLYKFTKYVMYVVVVTRWDGLPSPVIIVSTDEGGKCFGFRKLKLSENQGNGLLRKRNTLSCSRPQIPPLLL